MEKMRFPLAVRKYRLTPGMLGAMFMSVECAAYTPSGIVEISPAIR